ncbi:hypothetical protein E2C01_087750 [Portunus trituberculatus]|uniref:Uncharacterized protein n=1 Tax=Portunus trituberculatus TaxID=210409 RepID=A0A5B7JI43_PORTR|nr:hypothetical protein [Portunus trituberculatus]
MVTASHCALANKQQVLECRAQLPTVPRSLSAGPAGEGGTHDTGVLGRGVCVCVAAHTVRLTARDPQSAFPPATFTRLLLLPVGHAPPSPHLPTLPASRNTLTSHIPQSSLPAPQ